MKKNILIPLSFSLITFFLAGCTSQLDIERNKAVTPQQKLNSLIHSGEDQTLRLKNGKTGTVREIRASYLSQANVSQEQESVANEIVNKCFNIPDGYRTTCTYDAYVGVLDSLHKEQYAKEVQAKKDKCASSPQCTRDKNIQDATDELNYAYRMAMDINPYLQGQYDASIRTMCSKAGEAQRGGVTLAQMRKNLDAVAGISPQDRALIQKTAHACWVLSSNGIHNGNERIQVPAYY
jgi:hypothetical protein